MSKFTKRNLFLITLGIIFVYSILINNNINYQSHDDDQTFEDFRYFQQLTSASTPVVSEWNRTWGGIRGDPGYGMVMDSSDNVYITGITYGEASNDILLVKYNSAGILQWFRTWGGTERECGWGVAVDSSNNIYLAGRTESFGAGSSDMLLLKYDDTGTLQWYRTWGGAAYEVGRAVAVDSSNNVYLAGGHEGYWTGSDNMHLVKYDSSGVKLWERTWGETEWDRGFGVTVDSSDNVYFVGDTESFGAGENDLIIVKYSSSGLQQWNRTWGGTSFDNGYGVVVDSSDCVFVGGSTRSYGAGDSDLLLVKYDSSGILLWNRTWGGSNSERSYDVTTDSSDNVYLVGHTNSFGMGSNDMIVVKYNNTGVQLWNRTWGGSGNDACMGIVVNSLDNMYLAGYTNSFGAGASDMVLVKFVPDIFNPIIHINNPHQYEKLGDVAPDYNISIVEPNLVSKWYTIDGGLNNYSFSQFTGTINQQFWDTAPNSSITLGFYAEDFVGNIGYSEVIVKKNEKDQEISGYNIIFLFWVISVFSIIIIIKRIRKN